MCVRIRVQVRELHDALDYNYQDDTREHHITKKDLIGQKRSKRPPQILRGNVHQHPAQVVSYLDNTSLNSSYNESCPLGYMDQFYTNISRLGEGSFGEVFKVRSKVDGQLYAIKKVRVNFSQNCDRNVKAREALRQGKLQKHDNCVELIESWEEGDSLYLKLELCVTSLAQFTREHLLSENAVWFVCLDLLKALEHIHKMDLIHLDIKLENIMITEAGRCKLGDFGIAAHMTEDNLSNSMEGDPRYMAPELINSQFSQAADIFSLGMVILEISTNLVVPTRGPLWHKLRSDLFPDFLFDKLGLSHDLVNLMTVMMSSLPERRPTSRDILQTTRFIQLAKIMESEKINAEIACNLPMEPDPDESKIDSLTGIGPYGGCVHPCCHRESPETAFPECDGYEMFNCDTGPISSTPHREDRKAEVAGRLVRRLFD